MNRQIFLIFLILIFNRICYGEVCGNDDCVNGVCVNDVCVCKECFTGPTCALFSNKLPHFEKSSYHLVFNESKKDTTPVIKVTAIDEDKCVRGNCECGEIIYSILEENAKELFEINSSSGEIKVIQGAVIPETKYSFSVKVTNRNPFDDRYDTATIFVNGDSSNEILERHRRATAPTKPAFELIQTFPIQNLTSINIGQRLSMQLSVAFPVGTTTLSVELFAPESQSYPVMMICDVNVISVGSLLTTNSYNPPLQEGINGTVWPYTHIVYNFTNVINAQSSVTSLADIQIVITFDVVMLYSPNTTDGATYYVSGGSEYLNGTEIWVGQLGYIANLSTPTINPTISITGDTLVYPGRTAAFVLTIQAPDSYLYLNLGIYSPLNNSVALSLCVVNRYYVGAAYSCLPTNYNQPTLKQVTINNQIYYTSALMNLGILGNRYYMEPTHTDMNEKTINISITARISPTLWLGTYQYIGLSISNTLTTIYTKTYQVLVSPAPQLTAYTSPISYSLGYHKNITSVSIGSPGRININISIPTGTELDYTIIARSPENTSEICGVIFFKAGLNIPCVDQITFGTTYVYTPDNFATTSITSIGGIRHVKISNNTDDDILQLVLVFRPINDSRNSVNGITNIGVKVNWTGSTGTENFLPVTLNAPDVSSANSTTLPTFTFQLNGNDGNVSVNGNYKLFFAMRLYPGTIYTPTSLEFYMPFNGTIRVGMCKASITYVGKNVLCFNPTFITKSFIFSSKINDTSNYDKLLIPTGVLCTSGSSSAAPSINDEIQISINILILPHAMNTVGATANLNGGMMISSTQIWVGNQPLTFITLPAIPSLNSSSSPLLFAQRVDSTSSNVWINDMVIIQYIIKVAPAVVTRMTLSISTDATVATNNFGVCQVKIINQGLSIPCVNGTLTTTPATAFSKFYVSGNFAFTDILNTGTVALVANPTFDENSLLVEVIVKLGPTLPPSFNVIASLTSNGATASANVPLTFTSAFSRFNGTVASTEPVFNMFLYPLFNDTNAVINNIAYSEAMRSVVSVEMKPNVLQSLKIVFASTPNIVNQMDVISVNILSVGRNIPCLQKGMIPFSIQQRSNSLSKDLASIDMGTICHRPYLDNTTVEDNKIYIESVFRIWKFPATSPLTLQINVLGLLNNDQVYVTRIVFNTSTTPFVTDFSLTGESFNANATISSASVAVGGNFTVKVMVTIPPYTQFKSGTITVGNQNPVGSDSFYFINGNANFSGTSGQNIGINKDEPMPFTLKSTFNTSQLDNIVADLGVVQNTATTYRMNQVNYSAPTPDDTLTVTLPVQLTDNSMASNGQIINFIVGVSFGSKTLNFSLQITVLRINNETMDFNTSTNLLTSNNIYTSTTPIIASAQAIMLNTSTLECRNFSIFVAAPPFIQLSSVVNTSYTSPGYPTVAKNIPIAGFSFNVPYFFYKENITIIFTMSVIAGLNLTKGRAQSSITIPVVYSCQTLNWPLNPMGNKYFNKVETLVFTVKGNDVNNTACNNDLNLKDSSVIQDCAISAYMSPYPGFEATKIRSNSGSYWVPHIRSGQYNKLRYIDIKFGKLTTVTKIVVTSSIGNKPQTLGIHGTMDGRAFSFYQNINISYNPDNTAAVTLNNPPFTYRGIRVSIVVANQDDINTGMNLDLFGCLPPNVTDTFTFDPCATKSYLVPTNPLPEFYYRGYLYTNQQLFVCDEIVSLSFGLETYPRCFRTNTATFTTWEDLGNQVGKVIGFDSVNMIIYAIASDIKSYIMSEDNGLTWVGINGGGWQIMKNTASLQSPIVIPWTNDTTFDYLTTGNNCTKYTVATFNFCYDGIYNGTSRIFSWNNCCNF